MSDIAVAAIKVSTRSEVDKRYLEISIEQLLVRFQYLKADFLDWVDESLFLGIEHSYVD
jgi:hypothetical protein